MAENPFKIDDEDDETLPASPRERNFVAILGCLTLLVVGALIAYFIATHTQTLANPPFFGNGN